MRASVASSQTQTSGVALSDASFVRFGGLAGILLAITSLVTVAVFYTVVPEAQRQPTGDVNPYLASLAKDSFGSQLFYGLYALIAVWALVGIVAVYYRVRSAGEAWAFFATLVGAVAAIATIVPNVYQLANLRYLASVYTSDPKLAATLYQAPSPSNPVGLMTFALTGVWFLIAATLMLRTSLPRLLAYLGYVAFADLLFGFVVSLLGISTLATVAGLIAGVVGGPLFWVWLGVLLWRQQE